jgi:hypothetical protein
VLCSNDVGACVMNARQAPVQHAELAPEQSVRYKISVTKSGSPKLPELRVSPTHAGRSGPSATSTSTGAQQAGFACKTAWDRTR